MRLRPATPDDADGIARTRIAAWRHAYAEIVDPLVLADLDAEDEGERWRDSLGAAATAAAGLRATVAEQDGRVVGSAIAIVAARAPDDGPATGELAMLDVHPVAQGAGVGGALLDEAERRLREAGCRRAVLRTLAADERARRFFAGRGWTLDPEADVPAVERHGLATVRWSRTL
ncbi:GNAT family N-acetyltransferase [Patulibacter defluvii]|uniref:GNAT family N-acetyltransferase n=1 Tax=Patulibacter defluvii TaxID=3095358 RepID=UPI002A749DFA|nr:GNAT family N-acetyltransferase [Patulibacter sp. DM4]